MSKANPICPVCTCILSPDDTECPECAKSKPPIPLSLQIRVIAASRWLLLLVLLGMAYVYGDWRMSERWNQRNPVPSYFIPAFSGTIACLWMMLDSVQEKVKAGFGKVVTISIIVLIIPVIGIPIYLFECCDPKKRRKNQIKFVAFMGLYVVMYWQGSGR